MPTNLGKLLLRWKMLKPLVDYSNRPVGQLGINQQQLCKSMNRLCHLSSTNANNSLVSAPKM